MFIVFEPNWGNDLEEEFEGRPLVYILHFGEWLGTKSMCVMRREVEYILKSFIRVLMVYLSSDHSPGYLEFQTVSQSTRKWTKWWVEKGESQ